METRLIPTANPVLPGDLADPWEAFLAGDLDFADLSPADQDRAREILPASALA